MARTRSEFLDEVVDYFQRNLQLPEVEVVCGNKGGFYCSERNMVRCPRRECSDIPARNSTEKATSGNKDSVWLSLREFESHGGRNSYKKPQQSIKLAADGKPLEDFWIQHGLQNRGCKAVEKQLRDWARAEVADAGAKLPAPSGWTGRRASAQGAPQQQDTRDASSGSREQQGKGKATGKGRQADAQQQRHQLQQQQAGDNGAGPSSRPVNMGPVRKRQAPGSRALGGGTAGDGGGVAADAGQEHQPTRKQPRRVAAPGPGFGTNVVVWGAEGNQGKPAPATGAAGAQQEGRGTGKRKSKGKGMRDTPAAPAAEEEAAARAPVVAGQHKRGGPARQGAATGYEGAYHLQEQVEQQQQQQPPRQQLPQWQQGQQQREQEGEEPHEQQRLGRRQSQRHAPQPEAAAEEEEGGREPPQQRRRQQRQAPAQAAAAGGVHRRAVGARGLGMQHTFSVGGIYMIEDDAGFTRGSEVHLEWRHPAQRDPAQASMHVARFLSSWADSKGMELAMFEYKVVSEEEAAVKFEMWMAAQAGLDPGASRSSMSLGATQLRFANVLSMLTMLSTNEMV